MTDSPSTNPFHANDRSQDPHQAMPRRLNWLAGGVCVYYMLSAVTLPFAGKVWFGEIPILGLFQIPKAIIKSFIHDVLLDAVHRFGWSAGSASPDYGMTHPWAMFLMCVLPSLVLVSILSCLRSRRPDAVFLFAVIICVAIDTVVTLSFDASSSLKLFNASF